LSHMHPGNAKIKVSRACVDTYSCLFPNQAAFASCSLDFGDSSFVSGGFSIVSTMRCAILREEIYFSPEVVVDGCGSCCRD